jgi:cytochrome bd-type quinol oxidase subunit 2
MSAATLAGLLLIGVPLAFNASFAVLAARFDYPDILRRPTDEILERYRQGGTALVLVWWAFALTAVLFAPLVVLLARATSDTDGTLLAVGTAVGVLAAVAQFLGLIRWPFLVPYLARAAAEPDASPARQRP